MKNLSIKILLVSMTMIFKTALCQSEKYVTFEKNTMGGTKKGVKEKYSDKIIISAEYDVIGDYSNGYFPVMIGNLGGLVDTLNKVCLQIKYSDLVMNFDEKNGFVQDPITKKWAMTNINGVVKTAFIYDDVAGFWDGVGTVVQKRKVGFIDGAGKTIFPCKFTEAYYGNGLILIYEKSFESLGYEYVTTDAKGNVTNKQDIGFADKMPIVFNLKRQIVYKGQQWERVKFFDSKEIFFVQSGEDQWKVINKLGKELYSYETGYKFQPAPDYIYVSNGTEGVGIISFTGEMLLKPNFELITDHEFADNKLAKVFFKDGSFFYIDKKAKCTVFDGVTCPQ